MIDILLPETIASFSMSKPPGPENPTAGMGMKYARVQEVLSRRYKVRRVSELSEVSEDFVIVDPVWFNSNPHERADAFLQCGFGRVLLYGSEQSLAKLPASVRLRLADEATWVTHNTQYLQKLHQVMGISDSWYLCDPVPEHVFYPAKKEFRVYASGQISREKSIPLLIEIFGYLAPTNIETCYIGSASLWGAEPLVASRKSQMLLERELRAVTDTFLGNISQAEVAYWTNTSMMHVHVAQHDCSCQNQQEAALGGAILFGMTHPLNRERPVHAFKSASECAVAIQEQLKHPKVAGVTYGRTRIVEHALAHWSYAAFDTQFENLLRGRRVA